MHCSHARARTIALRPIDFLRQFNVKRRYGPRARWIMAAGRPCRRPQIGHITAAYPRTRPQAKRLPLTKPPMGVGCPLSCPWNVRDRLRRPLEHSRIGVEWLKWVSEPAKV